MSARTVFSLLDQAAASFGDAPALCQPFSEGGSRKQRTYSWNDYKRAVQEIAAGLRTLGLKKGDVVALDSESRAEFYLADLGVMTSGSVAAALYTSYPPKDHLRALFRCDAKAVFVEDPKLLRALREAPVTVSMTWTGWNV